MNTERKIYTEPIINVIKLDNDISLALSSVPTGNTPPFGPGGFESSAAPEHFNNDPFKEKA